MEEWDPDDRRPMIVVGRTTKGWWPAATNGTIAGFGEQLVGYHSHPYEMKMNVPYFVALAGTFEERFGVTFEGIHDGPVDDEAERIRQFKTNIDVVMSVLEQDGLGEWLADRLVAIGDDVDDEVTLRVDNRTDPFQDERLRVSAIPVEPQTVSAGTGEESIELFKQPGEVQGTRRAISEVVKWLNHVTGNRFLTVSADLSGSINVEKGSLTGHYDPLANQGGTRFKAAIQEAGNASTAIGLVGQSASLDPNVHSGVWALSGSYGAFTPFMYLPARVWSQQNQDSPFRVGVLHILAGHSGPETAADARTHFGIFAPQVWKLFPRGQVITLSFWDYNDVAPGYFAAAEIAARDPLVGVIVIEVARPDFPVADRATFADTDLKAAAKGFYVIRDFDPGKPRHGYVLAQGSSSTFNLVQALPRPGRAGDQRQGGRGHQRGALRPPAAGLPRRGPAGRGQERPDGGHHGHAAHVAGPRRGAADLGVLPGLRLARPLADRRLGVRRDRRGAPGRAVHRGRHHPLRRRPRPAAGPATGGAGSAFVVWRPAGHGDTASCLRFDVRRSHETMDDSRRRIKRGGASRREWYPGGSLHPSGRS